MFVSYRNLLIILLFCNSLLSTQFHITNLLEVPVDVYVLETDHFLDSIDQHSEKTINALLNNERLYVKSTAVGTRISWGVSKAVFTPNERRVSLLFPSTDFYLGTYRR